MDVVEIQRREELHPCRSAMRNIVGATQPGLPAGSTPMMKLVLESVNSIYIRRGVCSVEGDEIYLALWDAPSFI